MTKESDASDIDARRKQILDSAQRAPAGTPYTFEVDGIRHLYNAPDLFLGKRLSDRLKAEQGWFEKLVKHSPSVGSFYEDTLRDLIEEVLPATLRVGTGFVFDPQAMQSGKQIDILVYDESLQAPLYRKGGFVVISPAMARSHSEVKKTLRLSDVREIIRSTALSALGDHALCPPNCQRINVFSFRSSIKTDRIFEEVVKELNFIAETVNTEKRAFGIKSFVAPCFYFLDRKEFIETTVTPKDQTFCELSVTLHAATLDNGLNEFLALMTDPPAILHDVFHRNFRTHTIRSVEKEALISKPLCIFRELPFAALLQRFPGEAAEIRAFRVGGKKPCQFGIPSAYNWATIRSFKEMCESRRISWIA